jgi:hypothetical protein
LCGKAPRSLYQSRSTKSDSGAAGRRVTSMSGGSQRSVRSFQISGNSTTSSILRR